jgi:hypothetical protein
LGHVRLALPIAAKYDLEIHHLDECTAFLGVKLEEEIYMQPEQGFFHLVPGSQYFHPRLRMTLRKMVRSLRMSLYGQKQYSHVWYGTFKEFVISIGLVALCVEGGLFVLEDHCAIVTAVVLYIDYLHIIANVGWNGHIEYQMKKRFQIHDLGSVSFDLGLNIERNRVHHTIDIHQHCYFRMILAKFRMDESRPVAMPMAMKFNKRKPDEEACDQTIYQSMIRSLTYAKSVSRPGITYAIALLGWYNHNPRNNDIGVLMRVFRYLNGTNDW